MNTKKTLLAAAIALGISGFAFADQGGDGSPNTNADDGSAATTNYSGNADSGNDNSTDSSDNSNNSDNSTSVADSFKIADSGNSDSSDNSANATGSYNTDNSDSSDNSANTLNLSLEVFMNDAELSGSVSGTNVTYGSANGEGSYVDTRASNEISGGSANFTGVGAIAQNAGVGSVTQANVSVMSNLNAGAN